MARNVGIDLGVNNSKAISSINTLKNAFIELNGIVEKTTGKEGKIKLDVDFGGVNTKDIASMASAFRKLNKTVNSLDFSKLKELNGNLNISTTNVAGNLTNVTAKLKNTGTEAEELSKKMKKLGEQFVASMVTVGLLKNSFFKLLDINKELSGTTFGLGISSQMDIGEIETLSGTFVKLSQTIPSSASSLAKAVDDLVRTGRSYTEARDIIAETAKLSTASGDNLENTAGVVTKIMVSLNVGSGQVKNVLNTLHSTAIQTASDMDYLANSFKSVAGSTSVFATMSGKNGSELDGYKNKLLDLSMASIGTLANLGLSASEAGTKVKTLFTKMIATEKTAKNMFNQEMKMNNILDKNGKAFTFDSLSAMAQKDLPQAVQLLSEFYNKGQLSSAVLQKMFTARHFTEISSILEKMGGDVDSFTNSITKGVSYTNDLMKSMFDVNNQMELAKNNAVAFFGGSAMGIGASTSGLLMMFNDATVAMGDFSKYLGTILSLGGAFTGLNAILNMTKTSIGSVFTALFTSLNPATLAIGGIALAIGLVGYQYRQAQKEIVDGSLALANIGVEGSKQQLAIKELNDELKRTISIMEELRAKTAGDFTSDGAGLLATMMEGSEYSDINKISDLFSTQEIFASFDISKLKEANAEMEKLDKQVSNLKEKEKDFLNNMGSEIEKNLKKKGSVSMFLGDDIIQQLKDKLPSILESSKGDAEEIQKQIKESFGKSHGEAILRSMPIDELNKYKDAYEEMAKVREEKEGEYKTLLEEQKKAVEDNAVVLNNMTSYINDLKMEQFKLTGEIEIDGNIFKGIEGLAKLHAETFDKEIQVIRDNVLSQYATDIANVQAQISKLSPILDKNELEQLHKVYLELEQKRASFLAQPIPVFDMNNIMNALRGINLTEQSIRGVNKGLAMYSQGVMAKYAGFENADTMAQLADEGFKRQVKILRQQDNISRAKKPKSSTGSHKAKTDQTYEIKYDNILKARFDIEKELLKFSVTKGMQSAIEFDYKLKTLQVEKQIALKEEESTKEALKRLKLTGEASKLQERALGLQNVEQLQSLMDEMYAKYKGGLKGKGGKEIKDLYEAIGQYSKSKTKTDDIITNAEVERLKTAREVLMDLKGNVLNTQKSLYELVTSGLVYDDKGYEKYMEAITLSYKEKMSKVYDTYLIPKTQDLSNALIDSMNQLNFLESLGNPSSLEPFRKQLTDMLGSEFIASFEKNGGLNSSEAYARLLTVISNKNNELNESIKDRIDLQKEELELQKSIANAYEKTSSLISKVGDITGIKAFSQIGDIVSSFGEMQDFAKNPTNKFDVNKIFDLSNINTKDFSDNLAKAMESSLKGINQGSSMGNLVGNLFSGLGLNQQTSSMFGGLSGIATGLLGMTGASGLGVQFGASLIGGLIGGRKKDYGQEDSKKSQESNKVYNKNTEALNKLAQNMSNLGGVVDGLNSSMIQMLSKTPTIDKLKDVTSAMTKMTDKLDKTRLFESVSYQITKHKSGKSGFLGIGAKADRAWTETHKVEVDQLLREFGYAGTIEDMTTNKIRQFSSFVKSFEKGDSNNFDVLASALESYAESLDQMQQNTQKIFKDSTMEAFDGISSLAQDDLKKKIEEYYKNMGLQIDDDVRKQIDALAEEMSVMVTITQDVRSGFISNWKDLGVSGGQAFINGMKPYIGAMLSNISQIYYDVFFSSSNKVLEEEFKNLSEKLVDLKRQGRNLNWANVTNELNGSFSKVIETIKLAKTQTITFSDVILDLQKKALSSGLTLSEVFNIGLTNATQTTILESFKNALSSTEIDGALKAIGSTVGDKMGESLVNKMLDNVMSSKVVEFSAQIDKILSGNMNFGDIAGLANEALSVGLMMEQERLRLESLKSLFDFNSDIVYESTNNKVEYQTGASSQQVYNYYITSEVNAGNVIESDSLERLVESTLDIFIDKLRKERGINI